MAREDLGAAVRSFYAAFGAEDLDALRIVATEDFEVHIPRMSHIPLQPIYRGIDGFEQLLNDRHGRIQYTQFDTGDPIVHGDTVIVLGHTKGIAIQEDRRFEHDWVHVFQFAGGRIRSLKEYIDRSEVSVAFAP